MAKLKKKTVFKIKIQSRGVSALSRAFTTIDFVVDDDDDVVVVVVVVEARRWSAVHRHCI